MGLQWVSWGRVEPCNGAVSVHVGVVVIDVLRAESDLVMTFGWFWSVLRTRLRQDGYMIGSSLAFALLCMWFRWSGG